MKDTILGWAYQTGRTKQYVSESPKLETHCVRSKGMDGWHHRVSPAGTRPAPCIYGPKWIGLHGGLTPQQPGLSRNKIICNSYTVTSVQRKTTSKVQFTIGISLLLVFLTDLLTKLFSWRILKEKKVLEFLTPLQVAEQHLYPVKRLAYLLLAMKDKSLCMILSEQN